MSQFDMSENNPAAKVFSDTPEDISTFLSPEEIKADAQKQGALSDNGSYINTYYQVPVAELRNNIVYADNLVSNILREIDENLGKVNINPYSNPDLDVAHSAVWKDALKHSEEAKELSVPDHITYAEYAYATEHQCRSCRELVKQYDLTVSHTTYGHLFDLRKVLTYIKNELTVIKNISIHHIKGEYRDETEGEIARHMSDWAGSVAHYTKLIAEEILRVPEKIPDSELDKITKKQAAQFEAFFALKVNSFLSEVHRMLNLIKRDCVDTVDQFYKNYLMPAMTFKSNVVEPLVLNFSTTSISKDCPTLNEEMVVANNVITGNLGSITTDLLERKIQLAKRLDGFMQSLYMKRKYVSYIVQLEKMATKRPEVLVEVVDELHDQYEEIFSSIYVDSEKRQNLRSTHADLDDLDGDAHPQYLRRDGGNITGDISVDPGAKIAGLDLANHSHSGSDGSSPISASNIDFESGRTDYYETLGIFPYSNLNLVSLTQNSTIGGGLYFDATFEIFINDDKANSYEFEILYNEV